MRFWTAQWDFGPLIEILDRSMRFWTAMTLCTLQYVVGFAYHWHPIIKSALREMKFRWFIIERYTKHLVLRAKCILPDCVLEGNGLRVLSSHSTIFHSYGDLATVLQLMENSPYRRRVAIFYRILHTHDQWAVRVLKRATHLLWHVTSVYNGHLQRPVIPTPVIERLAMSWHYLFWRLRSVAAGIRTPTLREANALTDCATSAACLAE